MLIDLKTWWETREMMRECEDPAKIEYGHFNCLIFEGLQLVHKLVIGGARNSSLRLIATTVNSNPVPIPWLFADISLLHHQKKYTHRLVM